VHNRLVARLQRRRIDQADEVRTFDRGRTDLFDIADFVIGRFRMDPGWRWSQSVGPIAGLERCPNHHVGYALSGVLHVQMNDGTSLEVGPDEMYEIPPGHDSWVVGDEPWVAIDFRGARTYARWIPKSGERVLATILFTDIVGSTKLLEQLGDAAWRVRLADHYEALQIELDRHRGREVKKTGDGVAALFDSPGRAVTAALAMARRVRDLGLEIRAGLHTGDVEVVQGDVHGVAVHLAARVMGAAGPGEVYVSAVTRDLAAGQDLRFDSAGTFELKGIDGQRELFRVSGPV
jgi:class 3 adenylate cyclase